MCLNNKPNEQRGRQSEEQADKRRTQKTLNLSQKKQKRGNKRKEEIENKKIKLDKIE